MNRVLLVLFISVTQQVCITQLGWTQSNICIKVVQSPQSCDNKFGAPLTPTFCANGHACISGQCIGDQEEVRNLSWYYNTATEYRKANPGEAGNVGSLTPRICSAKRACVCKYEPALGYEVCVLGGQSTQVNLRDYLQGALNNPLEPCVGPPDNPGGGGEGS